MTLGVPAFLAGLAGVAAVLHAGVLPTLDDGEGSVSRVVWLSLVIAFGVAELTAVHLHVGRHTLTYSFSDVPLVVGLAFLDPMHVVAARLAGAGVVIVVTRLRRPLKMAFNATHVWLETVLAAMIWHLVLNGADPVGPAAWLAALAVLAATEVYSSVAVAVVIRLAEGRLERQSLPEFLAGSVIALANVSLAVLVLTLALADWRAGWALVVLVVVLCLAYRSHSNLRRRHEGLEKLAASTSDITSELRTDRVAEAVLAQAAQLLDAELAEIDWWGDGGSAPMRVLRASPGVVDTTSRLGAAFGRPGDGPLLAVRNARDERLRESLAKAGVRDAVVAPLLGGNRVLGTLTVADRRGDIATFTAEDSNIVQTLANHAVIALHNAELADRLRDEARQRHHEALHDALTGLPNRNMFRQRLVEQLATGELTAVLLLDLDRFKEVNDTLGHHLGDELLKHLATRLVETLPDAAVVARLGGDEFTVLLRGVEEGEVARIVTRLRATLLRPFHFPDLTLHTDCSVGIALSPRDGHDVDVLLQRADVAMYAAKNDHSGFAFYSSDRDQYNPRRLALVADLRRAIGAGDLQVHYQPKVDLRSAKAVGVEALVRWNHHEYGPIPPDEFLPVAEQTDLMLPLTSLVLERALAAVAAWEQEGLALGVAVNISPRMLLEPCLLEKVAELLGHEGLRPDRLTLEITEGSVMADPERAIAVLDELDAMGVRLSLDDFGTGYSSLSYLRRLPVHEVKIDKSFILHLRVDGSDAAIVQSTIDLAHRLGMHVVAEGIETADASVLLRQMGCDVAQGYLLGRPMPASAVAQWAREWSRTSLSSSLRH